MSPIEQVKPFLIDDLRAILAVLLDEDLDAAVFFTELLSQLEATETEADLLDVFLALSTTAFQGFHFGPKAIALIDRLLERAQQISATFAAVDGVRH